MSSNFDRDEPVFAIKIVAQKVGVHQQTIRNYERWGLIKPRRSAGGTRFFSQRDLVQIYKIRDWMSSLGINRAGIEIMLQLMRRIEVLEAKLAKAQAALQERQNREE